MQSVTIAPNADPSVVSADSQASVAANPAGAVNPAPASPEGPSPAPITGGGK